MLDFQPLGAGDPERPAADASSGQEPSANSQFYSRAQARPTLRRYQHDVVQRLKTSIAAGRRRPLLAMVTGSGKTVVAAYIIEEAVRRRERVLFLAHRHELITQCSAKLLEAGVHDHA